MSGNDKTQRPTVEQEFDAFLRDDDSRLAALYRKLPQPEPDAQLDARVRALAQRALLSETAAVPAPSGTRKRPRWLPAIGAAAAFALAAGIAWRAGPQMWPVRDKAAATSADAGANAVASLAKEKSATADSVGRSAPAEAPAAALARETVAPAQNAQAAASKTSPRRRDAPASLASRQLDRAEEQKSAPSAFPAVAAPMAAPPPAPSAPPPASGQPAPAADVVAEPIATASPASPPAPEPQRAAKTLTDQSRGKIEKLETSVPAAPPAEQARAVSGTTRADEELQKQQFADHLAAAPALARPGSALLAGTPANWSAQDASGALLRGTYPPDIPPTLMSRIVLVRELLRDGRREDALHALADFRKRYPRDQWPRDLLAQLDSR